MIVRLLGTTRDGKICSSTHTITIVNKDRMEFQTTDRVVGMEKKPDGKKIIVVRRPPMPSN